MKKGITFYLRNFSEEAYIIINEYKSKKRAKLRKNEPAPTYSKCVAEIVKEWKNLKKENN